MRIWISALLGGMMLVGYTATLTAQTNNQQSNPNQNQGQQFRRGWGNGQGQPGQARGQRGNRRNGRFQNMTPEEREKMQKQWQEMREKFEKMTPEEREKWQKEQQEKMQKRFAKMQASQGIAFAIDLNQDGILSKLEIKNAAANLKKLDKNRDGKLTSEELIEAIPEDQRRGPGMGGPGMRGMGPRGQRGSRGNRGGKGNNGNQPTQPQGGWGWGQPQPNRTPPAQNTPNTNPGNGDAPEGFRPTGS